MCKPRVSIYRRKPNHTKLLWVLFDSLPYGLNRFISSIEQEVFWTQCCTLTYDSTPFCHVWLYSETIFSHRLSKIKAIWTLDFKISTFYWLLLGIQITMTKGPRMNDNLTFFSQPRHHWFPFRLQK